MNSRYFEFLNQFTDCIWLAGHSSVGSSIKDEHGALRNNLFETSKALETLFESGDADFEAYTAAGINELKKGNPDEALSLLIDATSLERNYSRAYAFLAVAHLHAGEPEIAFRQLEMAENLDPNDPLPNIIASQIHAGLFQTEEAISQAEKVNQNALIWSQVP